ncbi:jg1510 [Pararge aegeria aegeria]|uniref:Jg1510 protein n=1 Tax=Pararge aegeria aegeria TaxID=348720 RepID=A0A8S4S1P6_9NEOP|nr:jg1510 [Pararge aegeria aegeria]
MVTVSRAEAGGHSSAFDAERVSGCVGGGGGARGAVPHGRARVRACGGAWRVAAASGGVTRYGTCAVRAARRVSRRRRDCRAAPR